jgi:hypothetical protein
MQKRQVSGHTAREDERPVKPLPSVGSQGLAIFSGLAGACDAARKAVSLWARPVLMVVALIAVALVTGERPLSAGALVPRLV